MADTLTKELIKEICATGDKTETIPATTESGSNALSYAEGFPIATATPQSDGGIPPKRTDMNKVLNVLSKNQVFLQNGGAYSFDNTIATGIGGYPKGARVLYNDGTGSKYYVESLKNGNTDAPSSENILTITANFTSMQVVNSSSELTTPTDPTKINYALCLGDSLVYMWSTTYQSWSGYQLYRNYVISNLNNNTLYIFNGTNWISADNEYSWVAYRTNITNNVIGITKYALENLSSGTKDTIYHPIRPTVVIFGATTTQSNRYWYLDVSTDGENFTTIAGYQVQSGDPNSLAMFSIVLDADIYWRVRTSMTNTANYKIQYAYLY